MHLKCAGTHVALPESSEALVLDVHGSQHQDALQVQQLRDNWYHTAGDVAAMSEVCCTALPR